LEKLVDLLEMKDEDLLEKVCGAILNLMLNAENREAIRKLDGIAPLIDLMDHKNPKIQYNACGM